MYKIICIVFLFLMGCSKKGGFPLYKELVSIETLKAVGRNENILGKHAWVYSHLELRHSKAIFISTKRLGIVG